MVAATEKFTTRPPSEPGHCWKLNRAGGLALADPSSRKLGIDPTAMSASYVITSRTPDRVGDVVETRGISLANFAKNPTSFVNHQGWQVWPLPVGKWKDPEGNLTIVLEETRAIGTLYFDQSIDVVRQIFALIDFGAMNAVSIGFNPLVDPIRRGDGEYNPNSLYSGFYFEKIDLLEISVCGVGCHPEAVIIREQLEKGVIAGEPISPEFRKALEPLAVPLRTDRPRSTKMAKKDGMTESSSTEGGAVVAEGTGEEQADRDAIRQVGEAHKAEMGPGHKLCVKGTEVHHEHPEGHPEEHLAAIKEDLMSCKGCKSVMQEPKPAPEGFGKVWPEESPDQPPPEKNRKRVPLPKPIRYGGRKKKDMTEGGEATADGATSTPGEEETSSMPHGAETAAMVLEALEGMADKHEPETEEFFNDLTESVRDWAKERYPDLEFGGEGEGEEDDSEEEEDEKATEEIVDQYRRGQIAHAKLTLHRYAKRMSKRVKGVVMDAADHMGDMGELQPDKSFTRTHKTACKAHCRALKSICRDMDEDDGMEGEERSLDTKKIAEALSGVAKEVGDMGKQLSFGRRK